MKDETKFRLFISGGFFAVFALFTFLVKYYNTKPIGQRQSVVGFADINAAMYQKVNIFWYDLTQCLGYIAILTMFGFALFGLFQLITRRSLFKVDKQILLLGALYLLIIVSYVVFEKVMINFRPVLIDGELEPSYPSSHTVLVFCVAGSTSLVLKKYIDTPWIRISSSILCGTIILLAVFGRYYCGIHWFTDILGGVFLASALLIAFYAFLDELCPDAADSYKKENEK